MCMCGRAVINGEFGYRWNEGTAIGTRPVDPPELEEGEKLLYDLPGRCGGVDSHAYHYRVVKRSGVVVLVVRHGAGDERIRLATNTGSVLLAMGSETDIYWFMNAIFHAHSDGKMGGRASELNRWKLAAAEKRIKTRRMRGSSNVKVWIEEAKP